MRKKLPKHLLGICIAAAMFTSCVNDSYLANPAPIPDQSFVEQFDTASAAYSRGWRFLNRSQPVGATDWGNPDLTAPPFEPYSSTSTLGGFLFTDYLSTSAAEGIISSWAVSPEVYMKNGDQIIFYTRAQLVDDGTGDSTDFTNRLQVRINTLNTGLNVGHGSDAGDFTTTLLDINPWLYMFTLSGYQANDPEALAAYPHRWTRFAATVYGVNGTTKGRFAFRYYIPGGGANGLGTGVGIDSVAFVSKK